MRVLFLNPPPIVTENVIRDAIYGCWCKGKRIGGARTPPHPLLQVATVLQNDRHDVTVIDAGGKYVEFEEVLHQIKRFDAVVMLTSVMTFNLDAEVLRELKTSHRTLITIVFGAQPTFMPEYCLSKESVDIIVRQEAEFIIRDLANALERNDGSWKMVRGIGYREGDRIKLNDYYPFIHNLDELPSVNWDLLPKGEDYFNPLIKRHPYVIDLTTRGCPGRCSFCMSPGFYGGKVRGRSADNVIAGFKRYVHQGYREVYLRDEMFTTFKRRNVEICRRMIEEKIDLTWLCSAKVGTIDKEMMALMKEAGCHTIKFGVESGVQEILDRSNKGIRIEQTKQTFQWAKEVGINTHAHLMIGMPGETEATVKRTIEFVKEIDPTTATFGILTPYPGTPLFEQVAEKHPAIKENFSLNLEMLHSQGFYNETFCELTDKELQYWEKRAHREFYLRPSYILK